MSDLLKPISEDLKEETIATRPDGIWLVLAQEQFIDEPLLTSSCAAKCLSLKISTGFRITST